MGILKQHYRTDELETGSGDRAIIRVNFEPIRANIFFLIIEINILYNQVWTAAE